MGKPTTKEKVLITSALPYVNNVPHMGNIIGSVLSADVFARFKRSQGHDVLYVCGTDEHGTTTESKATEEGLTPQELCDKYYQVHKEVYEWFNISFDIFGRTSAKNHHVITQGIFSDLHANGYIVEKDIEQAYCENDKKFLADRFIEGECPHCHYEHARGDQCESCGKLLDPLDLVNPKCKTCGNAPERKKSKHLFLDLEKLQPKLEEWFDAQSAVGKWTQNAITTTKAWLKKGLEHRAITRDLSWGVPVPLKGFEGKVFYVWFDAPIGYISITGQLDGINWHEWWQNPKVKLYQFMAKDNIPFHTIMFPASLIGTGKPWTLLHHINVTEYLQHEDGKFSKSRGTGLFGDDAMNMGIPADVYRYYLLVNRPEKSDTTFTWKDLQEKLNNELLANLGNLVNRTLTFIKKYHEGKIHEAVLDEISLNFYEWVTEEAKQVEFELGNGQEKEALRRIMVISSKSNQYFQEQSPWKTVKEDPDACKLAMFVLANVIRDLAILIEPFMPNTSENIFKQLNIDRKTWEDIGDIRGLVERNIGEPEHLFQELKDEDLEKLKGKKMSKELKPLQIKAGTIVDVYRHPKADKLYVESVDFGGEMRTIVSGLRGHISQEELRGKTALFVTNLAAANLRGIESQGMILVVEAEKYEVIFVDAPAGTIILGDGNEKEITIDDFQKHKLESHNHTVMVDGKQLDINGKPVKTKSKEGKVC